MTRVFRILIYLVVVGPDPIIGFCHQAACSGYPRGHEVAAVVVTHAVKMACPQWLRTYRGSGGVLDESRCLGESKSPATHSTIPATDHRSRAGQIVRQLMIQCILQQWLYGTRFGSTIDLCEKVSIDRSFLRQAIRILESVDMAVSLKMVFEVEESQFSVLNNPLIELLLSSTKSFATRLVLEIENAVRPNDVYLA